MNTFNLHETEIGEFYIQKVLLCPRCDGAGATIEPSYSGSGTWKDKCYKCDGSGKILIFVKLQDANRELMERTIPSANSV